MDYAQAKFKIEFKLTGWSKQKQKMIIMKRAEAEKKEILHFTKTVLFEYIVQRIHFMTFKYKR